MLKFAVFDSREYDRPGFDKFSEGKDIELKHYETKLNADTVILAKGYDGVIVFVNDTVDSFVIDKLCQYGVKLIALRCAGFNNVDLNAAKGRIPVVRVPAYSPRTVAEHTMAMLLTSIRRIHKAYIRTRNFNFSVNDFTGFEFYGKTVGVIGTGKIGRAFIDICNGFGMNVVAYDIYPDESVKAEYVTLDELFARSDIISLHCPLTKENRHIINSESIAKMKKGVVIANTSRGLLIDTQALINGIKEKKVGAACLDVYEEESDIFFEDFSGHIVQDDTLTRLIAMPNVIVTSHQAFLTKEALENIAETTINNIESFFKGNICNEVTA
ncbi:MAG: 2-hydroxyacid dehydrogenase [Acutalibacteraceae bacterium]|nr:2-hydroxyacid dehydrogenase [Oscillospiraceae bacterium]